MLAVWLLVACAPSGLVPELTAVSPDRGWTGEDTRVSIVGEHLLPALDLGAIDPVDAEFEAWIEASPRQRLRGVELLDYQSIAATVPSGIEPGVYDLVVTTPTGGEAILTEAFRVTSTRADHLVVSTGSAAYDLGESATLTLELRDPEDHVVAEAMPVEIVATSPTGASGVGFHGGTLQAITALDDAVGLRGTLNPDGSAQVLAYSTEPDDVTFTVRAVGDDGIDEGRVLLSWDPGGLAEVEIELPFSPFRVAAGVPFTVGLVLRDQLGNELPDTYARILLTDDCNSELREIVDVVGSAEVDLTLKTACEVDHLYALNTSLAVESEPFEVIPAEHASFDVLATPSAVTAGSEPILVLVTAVDAYQNTLFDHEGSFTLADSAGGLDQGRTICPDFNNGESLCITYLATAGTAVVVSATDDESGVAGFSEPVVVAPDAPTVLTVRSLDTRVVAGAPFAVHVAVTDAWSNVIEIEPGGADPIAFEDDTGTVACDWTGPVGDGAHAFSCTITVATTGDALVAVASRMGLEGVAPDLINIDNGPLAEVSVTVPAVATAGQSFTMALAGFDAHGNPYLVQSDPVVDLADATGTLDLALANLDAAGAAVVSATLTMAGSTTLTVSQGGTLLGESAAIEVSAGTMSAFEVDPGPWIVVSEGAELMVRATDAFGNAVAGYAGTVTVADDEGACDGATLTAWSGGKANASVDCTAVALADVFRAVDGAGRTGVSPPVDVVDLECTGGPVADLLVDGDTERVACLAGDEVTVDLDASASSGSGLVYVFTDSEGIRDRGIVPVVARTWFGAGPRDVALLVVEPDGCGSVASASAWVGEDDGEPTGPVEVSVAATSVATGGSTTVTAAATDCNGDVASGQLLFASVDLGSTSAASTGAGLAITLDGSGEGSFTWSFTAGHAGVATVRMGSASAGGYGDSTVTVTQDSARPHVVAASPSGVETEEVTAIVVSFDENMLESASADVSLSGPSGAVSTTQALAGDMLTITPASAIDPSLGTYTLTLGTGFRDQAGNRLAGDWSSGAAAFTTAFGNVGEALPLVAGCAYDLELFRPDGDDGVGEEADSVTITPVTSGAPWWWWLRVEDGAGAHVRSHREPGTAADVAWDGRGDDGFVVASGEYTVTLSPIDINGNIGTACTSAVFVDHRLELP